MMKTSDAINTTVLDLLIPHLGFNVKDELGGLKIDLVVENDKISVRLTHGKSGIDMKINLGTMFNYAWEIKYGTRGTIKVIPAVRFVRQITGWDLKTAKEYIDKI